MVNFKKTLTRSTLLASAILAALTPAAFATETIAAPSAQPTLTDALNNATNVGNSVLVLAALGVTVITAIFGLRLFKTGGGVAFKWLGGLFHK